MKEDKRARRIRDKQRMKARARRFAKHNGWQDIKRAEKHADYIAVCSCTQCGNPRRHFGDLTLAERRVKMDIGESTAKGHWLGDMTCKYLW